MDQQIKIVNIVKKLDGENSGDFSLLPWTIILLWLMIILIYLVKIELNSNGTNWEKNKCSSKYVFFSGFMKNDGNALKQSLSNFNECIQRFV